MIHSLLATIGMVGLAAGLFGLLLARMLVVDGSEEDATETRHNARMLLMTAGTLLIVAVAGVG